MHWWRASRSFDRVNEPRPLSDAPLGDVKVVFADVDGTITSQGKLESNALRALELLRMAGVEVVLVSGRSSAWAECWARQWPIRGAIAENGALWYAWEKGVLKKRYAQPEALRRRHRAQLMRLFKSLKSVVPRAALATDAFSAEVDLPIDYNEDKHLGLAAAAAIEAHFRRGGAHAVRSSVHVNVWLGGFDKRKTAERFLVHELKMSRAAVLRECVFVGDSLNDAPMFGGFALSVGVRNVLDVWPQLEHTPRYVTRKSEGHGFRELADAIVEARR